MTDSLSDFFTGRPMTDHRSDATYLRRGRRMVAGPPSSWLLRPGWQRQLARLTAATATAGAAAGHLLAPGYTDPTLSTLAAVGGARVALVLRRRWRTRAFRAAYLRPTEAAIADSLDVPFTLHVSQDLGELVPRLAKPMSPAGRRVREEYGRWVEPGMRLLPDLAMRGWWAAQAAAKPLTDRLEVFRVPREEHGPRIEVTVRTPFLSDAQTKTISAIVKAKIPAGSNLDEKHDQVGDRVTMRWTVRRRPPAAVGYADVAARVDQLADGEFFLGLGIGGEPYAINLDDDSPHVAISAGTGAGKSVLAQLVAVQVLRDGGEVIILDRKGSHRWAKGLPGVSYYLKAQDMHPALIGVASLADARNTHAFLEDGTPLMLASGQADDGHRILVIAEELNATIGQLRRHWADIRQTGDPVTSPAITALAEILQMGRSARVNMIGIAQMLTARAIGGPEARENFVVRCLARYTANAWKMLCDGVAMPRTSRHRGLWQIVVGGVATAVQVAFLTPDQARKLAVSPLARGRYIGSGLPMSPGQAADRGHPADPMDELLTLREAVDAAFVHGGFAAAKKRLQRAGTQAPVVRGQRGTANLYRAGDLYEWASGGVR